MHSYKKISPPSSRLGQLSSPPPPLSGHEWAGPAVQGAHLPAKLCLRPQGRQPPLPSVSTTREAAPMLPRQPRSTPPPPCAPPRLCHARPHWPRRRRRATAAALSASALELPHQPPRVCSRTRPTRSSKTGRRRAYLDAWKRTGGGGEGRRREFLAACRRHFE